MRASGILLPIASLPSRYGIGTFGKAAYDFVDSLKAAQQRYWQILPLGPTSYGDSPYQSFSTFAGNPYFIDLETLCEQGLLLEQELETMDFGDNEGFVNYEKLYKSRFIVLRKAFVRFMQEGCPIYDEYKRMNEFWIDDYALFMAVKAFFNDVSWQEWDEDIKLRKPEAMAEYQLLLEDEVEFYKFLQYVFSMQWHRLKAYTKASGIKIIGDIPIYVALDSSDTWANPELFLLDENLCPAQVSGCPPDAFSDLGQLWGNPVYDWDKHKETNYDWWVKRIKFATTTYDTVRIDHFRGFDEFYAIPYGALTAQVGEWLPGPGIELFKVINQKLGRLDIIAEDLGFLTKTVKKLLKSSGYPGMKVLQFAFNNFEDNDYLPHNYVKNCIVYTGTHDNTTTRAWYDGLSRKDKSFVRGYLNVNRKNCYNWDIIALAMSSIAKLAIVPMQDYLELGEEARINTPSTLGLNWEWRLNTGEFTPELAEKIAAMTRMYFR